MTEKELQQAIIVSPKVFPQDMPCRVCGHRWMQHMGKLCPVTPGYLSRSGYPVAPVMGTTTFIPDEEYYKTPNFDVI